MKLINEKPFIIFSVFNECNGEAANVYQHELAAKALRSNDVSYKEVMGRCKGTEEMSYIILDDIYNRELAVGLARIHRQEVLLLVDNNRRASLLDVKTNAVVEVGDWVAVKDHELSASDNWTYDIETHQFYTVINSKRK